MQRLFEKGMAVYLQECGGAAPGGCFVPGADIGRRLFWDGLPQEVREALVKDGEAALGEAWTNLRASDYREFSINGNRVNFERQMFARRTKLNRLVLAECVENQGRFLPEIIDGIFMIMEESTWCLPAHNSYVRDMPQLPFPLYERPVIDLFQAESAACLATAEYVLRPALNNISPIISDNINARLRERILRPYLSEHFWWMGMGDEPMNNWTVWCTQNVLVAVFSRPEGVVTSWEQREVLRKAADSVDYFLKEYAQDGVCDEGAQYYGHAGLCFSRCLDILNQICEGAFSDICDDERIYNMADYVRRVYVGDGYYINFADCSARAGYRGAREYLFGRMTGNEALMRFAAADFVRNPEALMAEEHNLYYRLLQLGCWQEMRALASRKGGVIRQGQAMPEDAGMQDVPGAAAGDIRSTQAVPGAAAGELWHTPESTVSGDFWLADAGLLIARDEHFTLAAKAGDNADSHNHNDVGSITLYKDASPLLIDLGVETYTKKTFSARRYEIWTMQSQYHNLPSFYDGEQQLMQAPGAAFAARVLGCELNERKASIRMDLADAYPDERVERYLRTVTLNKGQGVVLEDASEGPLKPVLNLMSYERPELVSEDGAYELKLGELARLRVEGAERYVCECCPITDARLGLVWKHECYRLRFAFKGHIRVSIE